MRATSHQKIFVIEDGRGPKQHSDWMSHNVYFATLILALKMITGTPVCRGVLVYIPAAEPLAFNNCLTSMN